MKRLVVIFQTGALEHRSDYQAGEDPAVGCSTSFGNTASNTTARVGDFQAEIQNLHRNAGNGLSPAPAGRIGRVICGENSLCCPRLGLGLLVVRGQNLTDFHRVGFEREL
jgi:hypothetical protein